MRARKLLATALVAGLALCGASAGVAAYAEGPVTFDYTDQAVYSDSASFTLFGTTDTAINSVDIVFAGESDARECGAASVVDGTWQCDFTADSALPAGDAVVQIHVNPDDGHSDLYTGLLSVSSAVTSGGDDEGGSSGD